MSKSLCLAAVVVVLASTGAFAMGVRLKTPATIEFKKKVTDLWLDHIQYERAFVQFSEDNNADAARVSDSKAAKSASDIADAIGRYYGKESTDRLYAILYGHYRETKDYALAALANNAARKKAASAKLYENGAELTAFLVSINPYISRGDISPLIEGHVGNIISDIDAVASKDTATDEEIYKIMQKNMKIFSDELSEAVIRQFPKNF